MIDAAEDRWRSIDQLRGFQKLHLDERSRTQREAVLARHPHNCKYFDDVPMTDSENDAYDRLNISLHEKIRDAARQYFRDVPLPEEYATHRKSPELLQQIGTAFTYQNPDWYGPTYEVYVTVIERYISADLLRSFQDLLTGEHCDWCIDVCACDGVDFDWHYDMIVFSDQILIQHGVANLLGIP